MMKAKNKPFTVAETNRPGDKLEIHWEKYDLKQFRKGLGADLADGTNKAVTSCASNDPNLIDKVVQAHRNDASDPVAQQLQIKQAAKREHDSKRAFAQAAATAHFR
mgnify:CR=1 FL=1